MKVGTRVLAYGLLLAWIPLLLIGIFVTYTIEPRLEAAVAAKAAAAARAKADAVNQLLLGVNNHLQAVATTSHERLYTMPPGTRQALFYDLLKTNPLLEEVYLLDNSGVPLDWVSRWRVTAAGKPEAAVLKKEEPGPFITNVHRESDGRLTSMICVPIRSIGWQQITGYLGGKVRLRGVADLALAHPELAGGTIFIVDQSGILVGHEDFSQVLRGVDVQASSSVQAFINRTEVPGSELNPESQNREEWVQRYRNYQGIEVLGSYAPVGKWGWAVIVEEERDKALLPVTDWMIRFNLIGIFLTLSVIALSYLISRKITKPIRQLELGVNKIARGEWDQDLPGSGTDEIGQLVAAFNHMLKEQREKKELEERLMMTDKLATLGTVATSVAHELNNPLAIISGYSEDLLDRLRDGDRNALQADGENYLSIICNQTKRCKTIIRAWLDTARIPTRTSEPINVWETVEAVRELLIYRAQKKGVTLHAPTLPANIHGSPYVLASSGELQQILLNVLINAVDACSEGDTVDIEIAVSQTDCLIRVKDTGIGISAENLRRLGTSFFTTKPPGQGTGLGLYISRNLLEVWGGSLTIDSAGEKQGTTVTIQLPLCEQGGHHGKTL